MGHDQSHIVLLLVGQREMVGRRKISSVWLYFGEGEREKHGRVSAVHAKACIYTIGCKPVWRAKQLLLATLCRQAFQHLPLQPTDAVMLTDQKR